MNQEIESRMTRIALDFFLPVMVEIGESCYGPGSTIFE
jgi:hypothetical protein